MFYRRVSIAKRWIGVSLSSPLLYLSSDLSICKDFFLSPLFLTSLSLFFFLNFCYSLSTKMATTVTTTNSLLRSRFLSAQHHTDVLPSFSALPNCHGKSIKLVPAIATTPMRRPLSCPVLMKKDTFCEAHADEEEEIMEEIEESSETLLYSFSPLPLLLVGALPGGM